MTPAIRTRLGPHVCRSCQKAIRHQSQQRHASSSSRPEIYDVVAVGGGPNGLALMAALKSSPITSHLRTALIEIQDLTQQRRWKPALNQYANRASSLTPSTVEFLDSTGALSHIDSSRSQSYSEMQVWDAANESSIQFDWKAEAERYNAPPRTVATMVENANLTRSLLDRLDALDVTPHLYDNTKVASIEMGETEEDGMDYSGWPTVTLDAVSKDTATSRPSKIAARLLIGADGINSPVRTFAGIRSNGWDYDRHGVVATLKLAPTEPKADLSNSAAAFQRFLPSLGGPIAILPLPDSHASLVWSTTPQNAAYIKSLPPNKLTHLLNAAVRLSQTDVKYLFTLPATSSQHESELTWRLQHTPAPNLTTPPPTVLSVQEGSVASFPLRFRHASTLVHPRVALIGDAAHTIHPLAGQGLNLGLADAKALAETIAYAVEHGMDIGDGFALERYNRERFRKGMLMAGGVDALNWMYQLGGEGILGRLIGRARGVGMGLVGGSMSESLGVKGRIMGMAEGM